MSLPALPSAAIALGLIVIGICALLIRQKFSRRSPPGGFGDWLRHPERFRRLENRHAGIEAAVADAQQWDTRKIDSAVRKVVFDRDCRNRTVWIEQLRSLGTKTQDAVLRILRDPSLRHRLAKQNEESLFDRAPFAQACDLVREPPYAPDLFPVLTEFLQHPSPSIRKEAALALGRSGATEAINGLLAALGDNNERVRSYALMGLAKAHDAGRLSADCLSALAERLREMITEGKNPDACADLLVLDDRVAAHRFLTSPAQFASQALGLGGVLLALRKHRFSTPRPETAALVAQLEPREPDYARDRTFCAALQLLAMHRHRDDYESILKWTRHSSQTVAEGATEAKLVWSGLGDVDRQIWDSTQHTPFENQPRGYQLYLAICELDGEVNNGGFAQYFFNSSGDHWATAQASLDRMGFYERAQLLREAIARFGSTVPSEDRSTRQDQLALLVRKNGELFRDLDDRYYACRESIAILAAEFIIANPDLFTAPQ